MNLIQVYKQNKNIIRAFLFVIGLLFLSYFIFNSWSELANTFLNLNKFKFLVAIVIGLFSNALVAYFFYRLLKIYEINLTKRLTFKLYFVGQIAKYIPGKIWNFVYQISHLDDKASAAKMVLANFELMIAVMYITVVVAVFCLALLYSIYLALGLLLIGMFFFLLLQKTVILGRLWNITTNLFRLSNDNKINIRKNNEASFSILFFMSFIILYLASYMMLLMAGFDFNFNESITYIAILSVSWLAGVLIFIVPLGIGVREFVFVYASSYINPDHTVEILLSIALLSRLMQIIQELLGVLLVCLIKE